MSSKLVVAAAMRRKAEQNLHKVLREEYPIGGKVRWVYNGHLRNGTVITHSYGDRIRVRNDLSGATYWISAFWILEAFATELGATA
ncbi:hypothetical protein ACVWW6_005560 [Bradyrhizobium sp. USDA 3311]